MEHISPFYESSDYNQVVQYNIHKEYGAKSDWKMMPLSEVNGEGSNGYCTTYFLYHKDAKDWSGEKTAPFYPIDVDCGGDSVKAQKEAQRITENLKFKYGVNPKHLGIFFSGRGFHIEIPAQYFGDFEPSKDLHLTFVNIYDELGLITDTCFKKSTQMYRTINSVNAKEDVCLHKIQLDISELYEPIEYICEMAKSPQEITLLPLDEITPSEALLKLNCVSTPKKSESSLNTPKNALKSGSDNHLGIQELMQGVEQGNRNNSRTKLVHLLKDSGGHTKSQIEYMINQMNDRCSPPEKNQKEIQATINKQWSYERDYLPPNSFMRFLKDNPFIRELSHKEYIWYLQTCLKANWTDGVYTKHNNSYNIYTNQVVYTDAHWRDLTGIPSSTCNDIKKRLEKHPMKPFTSKVISYEKTDKETGEIRYHNAFTLITHLIFNHHHFREKEKYEYKRKV